jgi:hypothetical protein
MKKCIAVIIFIASLAGCKAQIPNSVTADEYAIYSARTNHYFSKHPPSKLYLRSRTFAFTTDSVCSKQQLEELGVPPSLVQQLESLGDAEYRMEFDQPQKKLLIPWSYKVADEWELIPEERLQYKWIGFSRVAFNRAHDKAFFATWDVCGSLCGTGGPVFAHKENGAWMFENAGCVWIT